MEKELILCDTNILISWLKGDAKTIETLEKIGLENLLIPSITYMELIQGTRNKNELLKLEQKIKNYNVIHFNNFTSMRALNLVEKYYLSHGLLIPDAIIAATAITFNFKLFTYTKRLSISARYPTLQSLMRSSMLKSPLPLVCNCLSRFFIGKG